MGFLDMIKEQAVGKLGELASQHGPLGAQVFQMVQNKELGSLSGLVSRFQEKGLGDIVASWVGTGANLPISPAQLESALGSERIAALAGKFGIPPEQAGAKLAQLLPVVIDTLTPAGRLPAESTDG